MNRDLVLIGLIISVLYLLYQNDCHKKTIENMTETSSPTTVSTYDPSWNNLQAIQNLADISRALQNGGLTIPGNVTIQGSLNVEGNDLEDDEVALNVAGDSTVTGIFTVDTVGQAGKIAIMNHENKPKIRLYTNANNADTAGWSISSNPDGNLNVVTMGAGDDNITALSVGESKITCPGLLIDNPDGYALASFKSQGTGPTKQWRIGADDGNDEFAFWKKEGNDSMERKMKITNDSVYVHAENVDVSKLVLRNGGYFRGQNNFIVKKNEEELGSWSDHCRDTYPNLVKGEFVEGIGNGSDNTGYVCARNDSNDESYGSHAVGDRYTF